MEQSQNIHSFSGSLIQSTAAYTLADKDDNVAVKGAKYTLGTVAHIAGATLALLEAVVTNVLLGTAKATQFFLPKQRSEWFDQKVIEPLSQRSLDTTVGMLKAASRTVTNFTSKENREAAEKGIESKVSSVYDSDTAQVIKNFHINGWTPKKEAPVSSPKSEEQIEAPIQQEGQQEDWAPVKKKIAQQIEELVVEAAIKESKPTSNEPVKAVKVVEEADLVEGPTRVVTEETNDETPQEIAPLTNSRKYACIAAGLLLTAGIVGYAIYNGYGASTPLPKPEEVLGQCAECRVGKFEAPVANVKAALEQCALDATDLTKNVFEQTALKATHCGKCLVGKFASFEPSTLGIDLEQWGKGLVIYDPKANLTCSASSSPDLVGASSGSLQNVAMVAGAIFAVFPKTVMLHLGRAAIGVCLGV